MAISDFNKNCSVSYRSRVDIGIGKYLDFIVFDIFDEFDIKEKKFCVTCDAKAASHVMSHAMAMTKSWQELAGVGWS
jgi:hypothetical protein